MKSVLYSINPEYCEMICRKIGEDADGKPIYKKPIEVRKTKPKLPTPFKGYIYCTKPKNKIDVGLCLDEGKVGFVFKQNYEAAERYGMQILSGKIIGEFVCKCINEWHIDPQTKAYFITPEELSAVCLTYVQLHKYGNGETLYGVQISDLVIYDKPKELSEFRTLCKYRNADGSCQYRKVECGCVKFDFNPDCSVNFAECCDFMTRPPQSWCYVEVLENG